MVKIIENMKRSYFVVIVSISVLLTIVGVGHVNGAPITNSTQQNDDASTQFETTFTQFGKIINEIVE